MEQIWPDWLEYELNLHELESKNEKLFLAHSHLMLEETFLLTKERSASN